VESLIIAIVIAALICGLIAWVTTIVPIPSPWGQVIRVCVAVVFIIYLLRLLLPMGTQI
jgi:ABC-type multidrug transport system permease subunit